MALGHQDHSAQDSAPVPTGDLLTEIRDLDQAADQADRDRFILSKAHACPVLYAILAHCGYFPRKELWAFRQINSLLQGHAHNMTPGVEMSGGSLGQGLSFGIGAALAARLDGSDSRVYVMLGDGECDEGQVWEAAMSASHYKLDNLVAVVDRNGIQNDRWTHQVMELEPLAAKWRAFGWHTVEIDGHRFSEVLDSLDLAQLQTLLGLTECHGTDVKDTNGLQPGQTPTCVVTNMSNAYEAGFTPGMIGVPGKWPWKCGSFMVTFLMPRADL